MKKLLLISAIVIVTLGVTFFFLRIFFQSSEEKLSDVTISLPFSLDNPPGQLIPMGETLEHPLSENPHGHAGIDFLFYDESGPTTGRIIACADGKVTHIYDERGREGWAVIIEHDDGKSKTFYGHLKPVNPDLEVGQSIRKGNYVGEGFNTHWEFGAAQKGKKYPDRICPLDYLDPASRQVLLDISIMDKHKKAGFDHVCSGDYAID